MADRRLTVAIFNESTGWRLPQPLLDRLREAAPPGVRITAVGSRNELIEALPETAYLIGFPLTESQFAPRAEGIRWIQLTGSSGESLSPLHASLRAGIRVTGAARIRAPQCAEHALALMLALTRRIGPSIRAQMEHRWASAELAPTIRDLDGATVGLVAIDAIGEEIAHRVKAFGSEVIALSPTPDNPYLHVDRVLAPPRIDEFMSRSDIVIVATSFATPGVSVLSKRELSQMGKHAYLIDVSRGGAVDQNDLITLLRQGRIAGAGLDVFEFEPLAEDSPLWTMPNVILTPHVSSASPRYWLRAVEVARRNLHRIEQGKPLLDEITQDLLDVDRR